MVNTTTQEAKNMEKIIELTQWDIDLLMMGETIKVNGTISGEHGTLTLSFENFKKAV